MFANFTEETCTGTGATLALAGATTGKIPFSESFADGDRVAYVLEDSGGTIKISGVGTYVSATDDITRADTWNWNGTAIDKNPSTNITLSGGTQTIRCDLVEKNINDGGIPSGRIYTAPLYNELSSAIALSTGTIYYVPLPLSQSSVYDGFSFEVTSAGNNARLGLYDTLNGLPNNLLAKRDTDYSGVGTTGDKSVDFDDGALYLPRGDYVTSITVDDATILNGNQGDSSLSNMFGVATVIEYVSMAEVSRLYSAGMPDPAELTSITYVFRAAIIGLNAA